MSICACPVCAQPRPLPRSSRTLPFPKVELLKCGESVLETIKLVTEVQDPCSFCFSLWVPWAPPSSLSSLAPWCQECVSILVLVDCQLILTQV